MPSCPSILPTHGGKRGPLWMFSVADNRHEQDSQRRRRATFRLRAAACCVGLVLVLLCIPSNRQRDLRPIQVKEESFPAKPQVAVVSYPDANTTRANDFDDRPFFIFHVGPPKTATTTLQTELTNAVDLLALDNYTYLGQLLLDPDDMWKQRHGMLLNALKDRKCQQAVNLARRESREWPDCWKQFLAVLAQRRKSGQSIILSEENFAIKYMELDGLGRTSVDWPALQMALRDWRPVVVVGYRRLYDIMPSAKQQWDRWTKTNKGLAEWPPKGRTLQPLFPDVLKDPRLYDGYIPKPVPKSVQWSYTDHLVEMISPYFPVRLINMHDSLSIRSTFICRVLPYAPNACRQSQFEDAQGKELHKNSEQSLFYDAIVTEAAYRQWFDKSLFDRHVVHTAVHQYFETEMGGDPMSLPLTCPDRRQLLSLLQRSLVKERQILTPFVAQTMHNQHVEGFWKAAEKHKFCWIDVNRTLVDPHWKQFFSEIVPVDSTTEEEEGEGEEDRETEPDNE